ncbi:MAG TPA: hypothetical protein V6C84_03160 [Coleofasciculaceae cyanobacterium]
MLNKSYLILLEYSCSDTSEAGLIPSALDSILERVMAIDRAIVPD